MARNAPPPARASERSMFGTAKLGAIEEIVAVFAGKPGFCVKGETDK